MFRGATLGILPYLYWGKTRVCVPRGLWFISVDADTKASQFQGICPQDLTCCHGCSGKECNFHPPISSPESLSPEGLQLFNTAFDLADSTIPKVPNADTNNFGMLNTGSADLLRRPNSQDNSVQNIDPNIGKTTSDFFKQAPAGINGNPNLDQKITLPVQEPAQQESPSLVVPLFGEKK